MKPDLFSLIALNVDPECLAGGELLCLIDEHKNKEERFIAQMVQAVSARATHPVYLQHALSTIPNQSTISPSTALISWMRSWTDCIMELLREAGAHHQAGDAKAVSDCAQQAVGGLQTMIDGMNAVLPWSVRPRQNPESILGYVVSLVASNVHSRDEFFRQLPHYSPKEVLTIVPQCLVYDGFADGLARDILNTFTPLQRSICVVDNYVIHSLILNWKEGACNQQKDFVDQSVSLCAECLPDLLLSCINAQQQYVCRILQDTPPDPHHIQKEMGMLDVVYGSHLNEEHHKTLLHTLQRHGVDFTTLTLSPVLYSGLSNQDLQSVVPCANQPSVAKKM